MLCPGQRRAWPDDDTHPGQGRTPQWSEAPAAELLPWRGHSDDMVLSGSGFELGGRSGKFAVSLVGNKME